jgi:uncharacterized protein (TIGR02266 family)
MREMSPPGQGPTPPNFVNRAPRVEIVLKVEFESVGQLRADFLSNLSMGGMFVRTPIPFAVGQVMSLLLSLPGVIDPPARVDAEVRWVTTDQPDFLRGVGVAFKALPPELKAKLDQLLASGTANSPPSTLEKGPSTVALLVSNPILREIIKSELERLAKGASSQKPPVLELVCPPDLAQCQAVLGQGKVAVVVADADGLGMAVSRLVGSLRDAAKRADLPVVVMQGTEVPVESTADRGSVLLRKPVGMKPLFSTLVALATKGAA